MADWSSIFDGNGEALAWVGGVAVLSWLLTLLGLPFFVVRIPENYFRREHRRPLYADSHHPVLGWTLVLLKNAFGLVLVAVGLVMFFTPGQGLLTVLIGLTLLNFPGKFHLECWVVSLPGVLKSLNWLRGRLGKPPIAHP
jgi:hypothetical protein